MNCTRIGRRNCLNGAEDSDCWGEGEGTLDYLVYTFNESFIPSQYNPFPHPTLSVNKLHLYTASTMSILHDDAMYLVQLTIPLGGR